MGGTDNKTIFSLSDAWKFEVAGVLSPNLPNDTVGSWTKISVGDNLPSRVRQGGAVMPSAKVVAIGGCDALDFTDDLCAEQDATVISVNDSKDLSPPNCAAPRVGPALTPNYNTASSNFGTQVFMLLGTFNDSLWDDDKGLVNGEVVCSRFFFVVQYKRFITYLIAISQDIFDIGTGSWTRILPSGDPGSSNNKNPSFPIPREGAAVVSSPHALVGTNPSVGADILVFGGQDGQGNYLNDLWLLRGYQAALSQSNQTWSGFGNGDLQTGIDASGTGVTVRYMTSCAQALTPSSTTSPSPTSSSPSSPSSPSGTPGQSTSRKSFPFDTSVGHKALSPVSLAGLLVALVIHRLSLPWMGASNKTNARSNLVYLAAIIGVVSYAVGIVGLVLSFTSIKTSNNTLSKRASSRSTLKTGHGIAALILFIGLYASFAAFIFTTVSNRSSSEPEVSSERPDASRKDSQETGMTLNGTTREKNGTVRRPSSPSSAPDHESIPPESPDTEPGKRSLSLLGGHFFSKRRNVAERSDRRSSESGRDSMSSGPSRGFEVLNRGNRKRRLSANGLNDYSATEQISTAGVPRSLSDLSWLDRRRSVAAIVGIFDFRFVYTLTQCYKGDLDYALTQLHHAEGHGSTPPAVDTRSTGPLLQFPSREEDRPILPSKVHSFIHTLLHCFILGLSVVTLVALWQRAPKAAFVVFLIWTLAFYAISFFLAWRGIPRESILTVLLTSIKYHDRQPVPPSTPPSRPLSTAANEQFPVPADSRSPYVYHQTPYRRAMSTAEEDYLSSSGHAPDEDEDEEQRRIEQEMERRDVSIITVPKRKLWIANPS